MPDIIQLLPDSIANQIAAGEVVQRPASVVKELMENAVDAEATDIKLIVKEAGKLLIQVIDNGKGMSETDARMSLERHATSKLRQVEDLFTLVTMGFRGEALASIAAVSQLEIKTRQPHTDLGTQLYVESSVLKKQEPTACEAGTSVSVRNLFYNIPARRNFLKSNAVEWKHILEEFHRLALAYPHIAFKLIHGEEIIHELTPGKLSFRITSLFGKSYQQQLVPVQEETTLVKIKGYVGRPESAKKTRGEQYIFVNNRFIKSYYLGYAITTAYEGLLQEGSFPFYILCIEIDPKHIDVNVHPTKSEIKFDDERTMYGIVCSSIKQALGVHHLAPALDFQADVNLGTKLSLRKEVLPENYFDEQFSFPLPKTNQQEAKQLFKQTSDLPVLNHYADSTLDKELRFQSSINQPDELSPVGYHETVFQLQQKYIVRAMRAGLMVMDQQAAHERVLFEKYMRQLNGKGRNSQQCLFPQTVTFSPSDFALLMEMEKELFSLGFRIEVFGKNTLLITGTPEQVLGNEKELLEMLVEQFKKNQNELQLAVQENLARSLAKRTAIQSGQKLNVEEMESLVGGLFACQTPHYSPDGKSTFFILDSTKLDKFFSH